MYAFISGVLADAGPPTVVETGGVGYEIWVGERDRRRLPPVGEAVRLFTHLLTREDQTALYGFSHASDRELFRILLAVNGVGPKVALAILGDPDGARVLTAVAAGDPKPLLAIKGVGRRIAERVVLELKDKIDGLVAPPPIAAEAAAGTSDDEVTLALVAMGLSPERARSAVGALEPTERTGPVEQVLRRALRHALPSSMRGDLP